MNEADDRAEGSVHLLRLGIGLGAVSVIACFLLAIVQTSGEAAAPTIASETDAGAPAGKR